MPRYFVVSLLSLAVVAASAFAAGKSSGESGVVHADVFGSMTGAGNTGYAGYFSNTATSGRNYGVYAADASASGYGVYASNTTNGGYALYCSSANPSGCGGNEGWYNSSDIRLKAGVETLPPPRGLDAVMKLRPVTYHWKDPSRDQGRHLGLVAQEVEPLYPELVGTGPDGMRTLSYADFTVPLIKAVQELKTANDNLRAEMEKLRDDIKALKTQAGTN
jgi:trimeric autotransporter adhesin